VDFGVWYDESESAVRVETDRGYDAEYTGSESSTVAPPSQNDSQSHSTASKVTSISGYDDFRSLWETPSKGGMPFVSVWVSPIYTVEEVFALLEPLKGDDILRYLLEMLTEFLVDPETGENNMFQTFRLYTIPLQSQYQNNHHEILGIRVEEDAWIVSINELYEDTFSDCTDKYDVRFFPPQEYDLSAKQYPSID
jgi:hypothetical protein